MSRARVSCPDDIQLRTLSIGQLPEDQLAEICDHLDQCPACRRFLDQQDVELCETDSLVQTLRVASPLDRFAGEAGYRRSLEWLGDDAVNHDSIPPTLLHDGQNSLGKYRLHARLARGGMSEVFQAHDPDLNRLVAIKLLATPSQGSDVDRRFRREMEAIATLDHPNVVRALDAGFHQDNRGETQSYLVMQLIDGMDLGSICQNRDRLEVSDACEVIRQAALGLEHAHQNRLVHRDIKPSNLMLRQDGQVLLLDLGLARWDQTDSADDVTVSGQILGTVDFLAPEQAMTHEVKSAADVYSLGATLYKLLTGKAPFDTIDQCDPLTLLAKLSRVVSGHPIPIAHRRNDLPTSLCQLIDQCLLRNPDDRPQSAAEISRRLEPFCEDNQLADLASTEFANRPRPQSIELTVPSQYLNAALSAGRKFQLFGLLPLLIVLGGTAFYSWPSDDHDSSVNDGVSSTAEMASSSVPKSELPVGDSSSTPLKVLTGHKTAVFGVDFLDDRFVASASWDETVKIWDLDSGELDREYRATELLTSLDVSPDRRWVAAGGGVKYTFVWDLQSNELTHRVTHGDVSKGRAGVTSVHFSPDSQKLTTVHRDGSIWLHDANSGNTIASFAGDDRGPRAVSLTFIENGTQILFLDAFNGAVVLDSQTLQRKKKPNWSTHSAPGHFIGFENEAGKNRSLLTTPSTVLFFGEHSSTIATLPRKKFAWTKSVAFDRGKQIVTANEGGEIHLWDPGSGTTKHRFIGGLYTTQELAISPNGIWLVAAGGWHVETKLIHSDDCDLRAWRLPKAN